MKTTPFADFERGHPLTYPALDGRTIIATVENYGSQFPVRVVTFRQWGKDKPLQRIPVGPSNPLLSIYRQILDKTADLRSKARKDQMKFASH